MNFEINLSNQAVFSTNSKSQHKNLNSCIYAETALKTYVKLKMR